MGKKHTHKIFNNTEIQNNKKNKKQKQHITKTTKSKKT